MSDQFLINEIKKLEQELKELKDYLTDLEQVVNNSSGIAGWHQNGDVATFEEVGILPLPELKESGVDHG